MEIQTGYLGNSLVTTIPLQVRSSSILFPKLPLQSSWPDLFAMEAEEIFGGRSGRSVPRQDFPIEKELLLTLEEVFNGCTKKMKISRKVSL